MNCPPFLTHSHARTRVTVLVVWVSGCNAGFQAVFAGRLYMKQTRNPIDSFTEVIVLFTLASILALAGPAFAQAPQVIYACVQQSSQSKDSSKESNKDSESAQGSQQVRIVAANEPCRRTETRLQWNVTGPVGPQGPKGDPGPVGPQGTGLATGAISGRLVGCNGPVSGGHVYVQGRSFSAITGSDGTFMLNYVPPGPYTVAIEIFGKQPTIFPALVAAGQVSGGVDIPVSAGCAPLLQCGGGTTPCGPMCLSATQLNTDANNCGACGNRCASGSCVNGSCSQPQPTCGANQTSSNGVCVCVAGYTMAAGVCQPNQSSCSAGLTMCAAGCTDLGSSLNNCGACGMACGAGQACMAGVCANLPPQGSGASCSTGSQCTSGICTAFKCQ
jgi:hypothetical protein